MDKILAKFAERKRKLDRLKEREGNRACVICKRPMREGGFGTIPRICKKCEDDEVYK